MRSFLSAALVVALVSVSSAQHGTSVSQILNLTVRPFAVLSVTGDPKPLLITMSEGPSETLAVEDASTSFSLTTTATGRRIVVSLSEGMPSGTRLFVRLEGATGVSAGLVDISDATTPITAVSDLHPGMAANQQITYRFEADFAAGPVLPQTRTIVFTVTE